MRSIIKVISWLAIIVGLAFFLNSKLKLHIGFLEVNNMTSLYIYIGAIVIGFGGLFLTRDG